MMNLYEPISQIMTKSVHTAQLEDTVEHIESLFASHRISSIPIVDSKGDVFGIVSASDLLRFHSAGKKDKNARAWELCTYRPLCVSPVTSIREVAELIVGNKIHHIIVSEEKAVVGFVSAFDFVEKFILDKAG